ncbi:hypothetical protein ACFL35_19460, partial [Candidatus Riflebacteria bacterium]
MPEPVGISQFTPNNPPPIQERPSPREERLADERAERQGKPADGERLERRENAVEAVETTLELQRQRNDSQITRVLE